jgi:tetratricopeptide (TPR) repeat protein
MGRAGSCCVALALLFAADVARAEPTPSPFWRSVTDPNHRRAELLVKQGRMQLYPALGLGLLFGFESSTHRRVAIENAAARFERALELAPDHLEARLLLGKALAMRDLGRGTVLTPRNEAAQRVLEDLRERAPLYEAEEVALQLGNVHMRAGDFARAVSEYGRALEFASDEDDQAMLLGNLAEATMMAGDLTGALASYERALRVGQDESRVLALWGAAVTLDRLGERGDALAQATRALREDRAPFAVLRQSGVFFVPAYEAYYYEGIGALALANGEREGPEPLERVLERARSWADRARGESVLPFARVAEELRGSGRKDLAERWLGRMRFARSAAPTAPATAEALPDVREARALLWSLRALLAFARYAQAAGDARFAEDAREHVASLTALLAR